jgi:hypothetical protein
LAQTPQGAESERAGGFGRASLLRCHQRRCTCPFQPPPRRAGLANFSGRPCVGADPPQRNGPSAGALGPKFGSAGREESDTISDVVSQSADPIKFWFRSDAWAVLNLRGAHFGQYQRWVLACFDPGGRT